MFYLSLYEDGTLKKKQIYSPSEITTIVKDHLEYYRNKMNEYQEKALKNYSEVKKDVEKNFESDIESLNKKIALGPVHFQTEREMEAYREFKKKHRECLIDYSPMIRVTGCEFGPMYQLKCPICGEEQDITDTEAW